MTIHNSVNLKSSANINHPQKKAKMKEAITMNAKLINSLKQTLIVPIGGFVALIVFSFTLGWSLLSLLLFWFLLIPFLAQALPKMISKNDFELKQSIAGLIIFYAVMVFMIYEHYQTDYFIIMMASLICNIGLVSLITWIRRNVR